MKNIISLLVLGAFIQAQYLQQKAQVKTVEDQKCLENSNCSSNCCLYGQCMLSNLFCQGDISDNAKPKQKDLKKETDVQTGASKECDANWQCSSYCCFIGSCRDSNFVCKNDKNFGEKCFFDDDCNSGCCNNYQCSSYWSCHVKKFEIPQGSAQKNEEKKTHSKSGRAQLCDANWQCPSNCCSKGSCEKTNFLCQKDKGFGEKCAFNDDCNSGCCKFGACSSYFACHYEKLGVSQAQIEKYEETEIDAKTGKDEHCLANWQCPSNCCFLGSCKKSNFMCQNDRGMGEKCAFNDDCNSGCCKFGACSSYFACHYESSATEIKQIKEISNTELKKESQMCGMNWQCSSGCCYQGLCSSQTIMCRNQKELGDTCKADTNCNSGCCAFGYCSPFQLCQSIFSADGKVLPSQQLLKEYKTTDFQQHIKNQVISAKSKIGLQSTEIWGACDYNFQCSSSCCLDGTCTFFSGSCGDQNATGDKCQKNQDCLSSCCYDDGFTNLKKCSPIKFCTYEKKHSFKHDCKWNTECKSGCCSFGTCRKDMFWCQGQADEGKDCAFNIQCKSSCCSQGKCSYAMNCYEGKDYLRESNPELMIFYDFIEKYGSKKNINESITTEVEQDIKLDTKPDTQISLVKYNLAAINAKKQRPWYLYVGIVFGIALIIVTIIQAVKNRNKILNICKRRNSQEYSRLIEEDVPGRGDRI